MPDQRQEFSTSTVSVQAQDIDYNLNQLDVPRGWWYQVWKQTRTRIVLIYLLLMAGVTAASIPLFTALFLYNVDQRVKSDLYAEMQSFQRTFAAWKSSPDYDGNLEQFVSKVLGDIAPEDDNSLIFYINGEYYKSNPRKLPPELAAGSESEASWIKVTQLSEGRLPSTDPQIEGIIYLAQPLEIAGEQRGLFVAAHTTGSERQEALDGIAIFVPIVIGIFLIGSGLAWLATGRLLRPVHQLATTARSISETDLSQRLTLSGSGELVELANTFNGMMNRLQEAFMSQRNFINDAGHELRTPITIIQGHLELLDDVPPEMTETLEIIQDELDRMARLVNDMILLAKSERPDFLQLETVEITPFVEELLQKAQTLAERNWQLKQQGQGVVVADRQRLTGALLNLLNNAAQHTQPQALIELGAAVQAQQVRFWVRDMGTGIALSDQSRIFKRFARATNSRRRSDGSGLGLAIVQAIAEAHGGQVHLASKPGYGSTFTLILPLDSPKERPPHDTYSDR
ncbi:MAG: HAMP domain-containing protein [Pegethrix bostrychoides GSE-TBD4-15B]|jgi:signal transduction histidine kinase|uniref:histidine kinase n=1 Tax=Pegethrix bostrychoides GSE-TBD4-15B TaxID=2839662 RepID=A0A951U409_9CYAN|nr:HAMP domain-containing protein [Pegethrix bostrychoides GSE-TBD4-15B]